MPDNNPDNGSLDKKDAREILDLRAKEISLVDRDAIQVGFLVVKRQEEETMGAFESEGNGTPEVDELIEKMQWSDYEDVEKALPADLRKAIKEAVAWMKKNAKGEDAPAEAIGRVAAFLGKIEGGKFPFPQPTAKQDKCPKCGGEIKDGVCTECGEKLKTDEGKDKDDKKDKDAKDKKDDKDVSKSDDGNTVIKIGPEGVEISGSPIQKGTKGFTAERTKNLTTAVKDLLGMLAEVDVEATKSIIEELVKAALPGDLKWTSGTTPAPATVKKSDEPDLGDIVRQALEPVVKKVEDLSGKVEEITKARSAPQSEAGNDSTDTTVTKDDKDKKSFWGGVPIAR